VKPVRWLDVLVIVSTLLMAAALVFLMVTG
jgi:hypothetical protein